MEMAALGARLDGVSLTIAEELLLLAHGDDGKRLIGSTELDRGVAGALIVELALAGRLAVEDNRLVVRNASPTGDPELDAALHRIAEEDKRRKPKWWVEKLDSKQVNERVLTRLAERGVLREETHRILGFLPTTRYPAQDPGLESEVRERLYRAVMGADQPDDHTVALAALLHACGLSRKVIPEVDRATLKRRMKELTEGEWAGKAVKDAIEAAQAVVIAGATAAGTASSS